MLALKVLSISARSRSAAFKADTCTVLSGMYKRLPDEDV